MHCKSDQSESFPFADAMRFQNHEIFRSVIDVLSDRCERVLAESQDLARGSAASPSRMSSPGSRKMTPYRGKPSTPVVSSSQMYHLKVRKLVLNLLYHLQLVLLQFIGKPMGNLTIKVQVPGEVYFG